MFHWKGGVGGAVLTTAAYILAHSNALVDLAGPHAGIVSTILGAIGLGVTLFSNKVGAPKSIGDVVN